MKYSFESTHIKSAVRSCLEVCKDLGYALLDQDNERDIYHFHCAKSSVNGKQLLLAFHREHHSTFCLDVEARNIGLELKKHPKNKKLEIEVIRAFHKVLLSQNGLKNLANSA